MKDRRLQKLSKLFMEEIANIILYELENPALKQAIITRVEITPDLRNAKVYFTSLQEGKEREVQKALESSKNLIRSMLLKRLDLRYTPDIAFIFDKELKHFEKIWQRLGE